MVRSATARVNRQTKANPKQITSIDERIGERIRSIRLKRGVGQDELGDALGVTMNMVQKYERALTRVAASRLAEIARVLETPIEDFYK